jgi:hypothetical protein
MALLLGSIRPDAIFLGAGIVDAIRWGALVVWTPPANLSIVNGAFHWVGNAATFAVGHSLIAETSSYALDGGDLALPKALRMPAAGASLALTGNAAALNHVQGTLFPVVQATATTQVSTNLTTHAVNMPPGVVSGDLLIVFAGLASDSKWDVGLWDQATWDAGLSVSPPVGWTEQYDLASGTNGRTCVYYKVATGSEGATEIFTLQNGASQGSWTVMRVDTFAGTPEFAVSNEDSLDGPSITASWGVDKNLFLAAVSGQGNQTVSGYPANYTALNGSAGGNGHCWVASREIEAATDNPSAFTMSGTTDARSVTAVIRGD